MNKKSTTTESINELLRSLKSLQNSASMAEFSLLKAADAVRTSSLLDDLSSKMEEVANDIKGFKSAHSSKTKELTLEEVAKIRKMIDDESKNIKDVTSRELDKFRKGLSEEDLSNLLEKFHLG